MATAPPTTPRLRTCGTSTGLPLTWRCLSRPPASAFSRHRRGFRSDGTPLAEDAVPAFEVSVATEPDPACTGTTPTHALPAYRRRRRKPVPHRANRPAPPIRPLHPLAAQRVRTRSDLGHPREFAVGSARPGTIGDFELYARGVPQRVLYLSKIIDLGAEVNFGGCSGRRPPCGWRTAPWSSP